MSVPLSSITVHLDRLAQEIVREGWRAVPLYDGPHPLLRVFDPDVPEFGESITLVPGATSGLWWYRSSTGEDLAPHTKPIRAADPDPSHAHTIAELRERFEGVVCWWGAYTNEWWAVLPGGTQWEIVNAPDPDALVQLILETRAHR